MRKNKLKKSVVIAVLTLALGSSTTSTVDATTDDNSNSQVQTYVINQDNKAKSQFTNIDPSVSFIVQPKSLKVRHLIRKFLRKHFGIR